MDRQGSADPGWSVSARRMIVIAILVVVVVFLWEIRSILSPFLWALVVAYLLTPVVNYLNVEGHLPRIWSVLLIYLLAGIGLLAASRYLYPRVVEESTLFLEDIPRLAAALMGLVGTRPLGIDIPSLVAQLLDAAKGYTGSGKTASHLLVNAAETVVKLFLFLVSTFYLLIDAPRLRTTIVNALPESHRAELCALGQQINLTWQQYIRGELVLFGIVATATGIGLTIFGVPGALFLGLASGALELLPLVGPYTAGALAVSVAYFNGTNPFGWSQVAYGGAIALMYLVLRQAEDYFIIPHVLGRAVRLHPLVVLFSVAAGGIIGGLFGLIIAVPIAASLKAIWTYVYRKLLDLPVEFEPVPTLGGGVIEIPIHGSTPQIPEDTPEEGVGAAEPRASGTR